MYYKIVGAIAAVVTVAAAAYFFVPSGALEADERGEIEALFHNNSSADAYGRLKEKYDAVDQPSQHNAAHIFGEFLYAHEGLDGFSVCDGAFGFGCYHTFIAAAIAEHGEGVIATLDATCVSAFGEGGLGCFHGIGHGLLSYEGYRTEDVQRALELCEDLSWKRPLGGCSDGVFMENNFRVMETDPKDRSRPFTVSDRHEPCTSIPEQFREACYFSQPGWWGQSLERSEKEIATWCSEASSNELQRSCFRGAGYAHAPFVHFDAHDGSAYCDSLPASSEARLWCREGMAWALYADPALRDGAATVCSEGLNSVQSKRCTDEFLFVIQ